MNPLRYNIEETSSARWSVWYDRAYPFLPAVAQTLLREGFAIRFHQVHGSPFEWTREIAQSVSLNHLSGGVVFTCVPHVVSCIANKIAGIRAAMVSSIFQLNSATLELQPNFIVVEMPGRTFFEMKQFVRSFLIPTPSLSPELAHLFQELEHHAHR
ncbi:MAG: hypothetical protein SNJ75_07055 [Gemmataceae bacterium]